MDGKRWNGMEDGIKIYPIFKYIFKKGFSDPLSHEWG